MSEVVHLVPPPREPDVAARTSAETVAILEELLAKARAGELVNLLTISWAGAGPVTVNMSAVDRMQALGAVRTIDHQLARDWLDR